MALTDIPRRKTDIQEATDQIRQCFASIATVNHANLNRIVKIVRREGKSIIVNELGDDAAELASAFNTLRDITLSLNANNRIDPLP